MLVVVWPVRSVLSVSVLLAVMINQNSVYTVLTNQRSVLPVMPLAVLIISSRLSVTKLLRFYVMLRRRIEMLMMRIMMRIMMMVTWRRPPHVSPAPTRRRRKVIKVLLLTLLTNEKRVLNILTNQRPVLPGGREAGDPGAGRD